MMETRWIVFLVIAAAVIVPMWRLMGRAGKPQWLALFSVVPVGLVVLLWYLAYADWRDSPKPDQEVTAG